MLKKRRLTLICSLIGGMGVVIPSATTAGILISNSLDSNSSNNQIANVDGDDDNDSVPISGTKPVFLNKIKLNDLSEKPLDKIITTSDQKTSSQVKSYQESLSSIANKTKLSVAADTVKDYVNNLLKNMISPSGEAASFEYLKSDVNSFLLNMFNQNSQVFSLLVGDDAKTKDGSPIVGSEGIVPNLNSVIISGSFKFKNITDSPQTLKDVNGNPIEDSDGSKLKDIAPGAEIVFKFNTVDKYGKPAGSKINGIVSSSSEDSNKAFLNWDVDRIQFQIGTRSDYLMPGYLATLPVSKYNPSVHVYENFVFSKDKSAFNVCLDNISAGINPYDAINNLVGPNKMFNPTTLTGKMVGNNLKNVFNDNFNLSKSIASLVNGIFGSIYNHHNNGNYTMAQVIVDNAQRIANLVTINKPSDNEPINGGASVNKLIFDLLSSYSINGKPNANAKTIFQILYDDKDALIDYIVQNIPQFGDLKDVILSLFDGVTSPDDLFVKLKSLIDQFKSILQTPQFKSLFPIIEKVINNKDVYLLNLVSDKQVAQTIFDLVLNLAKVPKESTNNLASSKAQSTQINNNKFTLTDFLNKYESLFVNLITSSKDPVGEFISGLLQEKKDPKTNKTSTGLEDILSLVGFSASNLSPVLQKIFDLFFTNNDSLKATKENIDNIYNLFGQISNLFSDINMNKITMKPIDNSAFDKIQTTYSPKDSSFVVNFPKNQTVGYTISVNGSGWSIPNSFIKTLVNLAPKSKLIDFINFFLDDQTIKLIKDQAVNSIPSIVRGLAESAVKKTIDDTVKQVQNSINPNTTIKDLVNEIMFGYDSYDPNDSWLSIIGNINVSYSGENLYILPSYNLNGSGKTITNYQIISANLSIDPTDIANKSIFKGYKKSEKLEPTKVSSNKQTITKFHLSAQLYKSFNGLINNFIQYTAGRTYDIKSNIYLYPTKKDKNNRTVPYFELNPNDPKQNVAPNTFDSNLYIKSNEKRLGQENINQTKDYLLGSKDSWQGYDPKTKRPIVSKAGLAIINDFYDYQNSKLNSFSKYITLSQNFYGTGPGNTTISINGISVKVIGFKLNFNVNLTVNYDIRMMDSTIVLPYKVVDLSNKNDPKFVYSIRNELMYFYLGDIKPSIKFTGFGG